MFERTILRRIVGPVEGHCPGLIYKIWKTPLGRSDSTDERPRNRLRTGQSHETRRARRPKVRQQIMLDPPLDTGGSLKYVTW